VLSRDGIKTIYEYREGDEVTITSSNEWGFLTLKSIAPCKYNADAHRVPATPRLGIEKDVDGSGPPIR
jgi:hypothetical protein